MTSEATAIAFLTPFFFSSTGMYPQTSRNFTLLQESYLGTMFSVFLYVEKNLSLDSILKQLLSWI